MPFALEFIYRGEPRPRVELITTKLLTLFPTGETSRFEEGGAWNPALRFDDSKPGGLRFSLLGKTELVEVNGARRDHGTLSHGEVITWNQFQVTVFELPPITAAEWAMVDAARSSDAGLQVYADWVETQGATHNAEWARLVGSPKNDLRVGASFRALVARVPVERCDRTTCGQRWEKLELTQQPCVRKCTACRLDVTWCEDSYLARDGVDGPVAVDPSAKRYLHDLLPIPGPVG